MNENRTEAAPTTINEPATIQGATLTAAPAPPPHIEDGNGHLSEYSVSALVRVVKRLSKDPEVAHSLEDELYLDVLRAIAERRCEDPAKLARLALGTQDLAFARGCV